MLYMRLKDTCTLMFTVDTFTTAQKRMDEEMSRMCFIHTKYYWALK